MPDIKFNCPHCQQSLEAPEEMFGQQINCPSCRQAIKLPDSQFKNLDIRNKEQDTTHAPQPENVKPQAEKDVWKGNPSYLHYLANFIFGVLLLPAFGIGLLIILFAILDRNTRVYTITNSRVCPLKLIRLSTLVFRELLAPMKRQATRRRLARQVAAVALPSVAQANKKT